MGKIANNTRELVYTALISTFFGFVYALEIARKPNWIAMSLYAPKRSETPIPTI